MGTGSGKGGLRQRIFVKKRQAGAAQMGFYSGDKGFGEGVGIIWRGGVRVSCEGVPDREALDGAERVASPAFPLKALRACGLGDANDDSEGVAHHRLIRGARPVPFQHREFLGVERPHFASAVHLAKKEDFFLSRRQKTLHREFWRGVKIESVAFLVGVGRTRPGLESACVDFRPWA